MKDLCVAHGLLHIRTYFVGPPALCRDAVGHWVLLRQILVGAAQTWHLTPFGMVHCRLPDLGSFGFNGLAFGYLFAHRWWPPMVECKSCLSSLVLLLVDAFGRFEAGFVCKLLCFVMPSRFSNRNPMLCFVICVSALLYQCM